MISLKIIRERPFSAFFKPPVLSTEAHEHKNAVQVDVAKYVDKDIRTEDFSAHSEALSCLTALASIKATQKAVEHLYDQALPATRNDPIFSMMAGFKGLTRLAIINLKPLRPS